MTQRTWLITGVNSGFGRLMTEALLERGDRVAGTVRKLDAMDDLKTKYGDHLWLANLDMTDLPAVRNVVKKAFAELGTINVIVSNAGYGLFGAAEELSDDQVTHQLSTNLFGPIQLIRAALPYLRAQGGGRIIGLSTYGGAGSASGRFTLPCEQVGGWKGLWIQSPRNSLHSRSAFRS
jgi:NAD(P)-dependent dehydrogenase (short-subunit alcohol dehydrogenase family)